MTRAALLLTSAAMALGFQLPTAHAQCPDGAAVCADVTVGGHFSGSLRIGRRRTPRAQTVVVQPAAPPPPQGRVVVVQPAPPPPPPPRVVVAPPPPRQTTVVVETEEVYEESPVVVRQPASMFRQKLGVNLRLSTMLSDKVRMGGAMASFRLRPARNFAFEFGVGGFGGEDYNGMTRTEVPLMFSMMFFLPRASRFQMYIVAGFGMSWAFTEGFHTGYGENLSRDFTYFGGHGGLGGEFRVNRWLGLSADVRAFVRTNLFNDGRPEFYDADLGRESDTSIGALVSIGGTIYF